MFPTAKFSAACNRRGSKWLWREDLGKTVLACRMKPKVITLFFYSAGVLLLLTAAAKVVSSFGRARLLQNPDPLFGMSYRHLFWFASSIELTIALLCLFWKTTCLRALGIAWLATTFLAYRFGLAWIGFRTTCPCLGHLTDALHIPAQTADTAMKIVLAYLLVGSYGILFHQWWIRRKMVVAGFQSGNQKSEPGSAC